MKKSTLTYAFSALVLAPAAHAGLPTDIVLRPRPQAYKDTCQSYGMALAAASVPGSPLKASNAKELRETERELRLVRDALAGKSGTSPLSHMLWKQAIEKVSNQALTLDISYYQDFEKWVEKVGQLTGITNANSLGVTLSAAMVSTPVLTSVTDIDSNTYAGGHIVTVMGVDKGRVSPPPLAVLNPAVKVGASPERLTCELDDGPGDAKYQAFASIEKSYSLKKFDSGYVILVVRKR